MKILNRPLNGFAQFFSTFLERIFLSRCYYSVDDLPVYNWWQIHETGDLYLLYPNKVKKIWFKKLLLNKLWVKIYDGFIQRFGLGDNFQNIIKKKKYIAITKINRLLSGDKSLGTLIEIAILELAELEKISSGDFLYTKSNLEKIMGFQINIKKTTVSEFYTYLKLASQKING